MQLFFQHNDMVITLEVEAEGPAWRVRLPDGSMHRITMRTLAEDVLEITEGEDVRRVFRAPFARGSREVTIGWQGEAYAFQMASSARGSRARKVESGVLVAPMVGMVVAIQVEEGQTVAAYQPVAVIEAMKVMATLDAPFAGIVKKIHVQPNDRVAHGAPVME